MHKLKVFLVVLLMWHLPPPPINSALPSSNQVVSMPATKYVINVFFHLVRDTQTPDPLTNPNYLAYQGLNITENQILNAVKFLNVDFSGHNIFFKYIGFDIIKNSFLNGTTSTLANNAAFSPYAISNTMNIYFVENLRGYSGVAFMGNSHVKMIYNSFLYTLEKTLLHEIGHCLNLNHIFENYNTNYCEHVTREQFNPDGSVNPNFNAFSAGDYILDTPAQSVIGWSSFDENCDYIANPLTVDCIGVPYENILPANFMGYDATANCGFHFTEGQFQRMRDYLAQPDSILAAQNVMNDTSSLFEPFFIGGGTTNNTNTASSYSKTMTPNTTNTGVDVWNCGPFKMRYQPGLDYEFSNLPSSILIPEYLQYDVVTNGLFIKVKIPKVDLKAHDVNVPVCFGTFEPYITGDIKSLNNLGSQNYTLEELDKIKATDPDLYNQLQSGQYHIITKETESGFINQKMIYKN